MTEHVKTEIDAGIMTLTLARADKKNALSNAMYSAHVGRAGARGEGSGCPRGSVSGRRRQLYGRQ